MDCFRCGRRREFDRLAVERRTGDVLGALCERCERAIVSHASETTRISMGRCLVCDAESDVLFPQWDTLVEDDDRTVEFEYTVALDTPATCTTCAVQTAIGQFERVGDRAATD